MDKFFENVDADGAGNRQSNAIKALFRKVFATADGRLVIGELRRRIQANPKSEMECAKVVGMQAVIDMILNISGYFEDRYE
jgi:hypothetical protein